MGWLNGKKTYLLVLGAVAYYLGGAVIGEWSYMEAANHIWVWLTVGAGRSALDKIA